MQGLLVCRHCGYALYGLGTRHQLASGVSVVHSYYRCIGRNGNRFGGQRLCDNPQVRVDDLDEAIWQDVCELLRDPGKLQAEYERRLDGEPGPQPTLVEEQLGRQIKKVQSGLARLIDGYQEGLLQKEEFEPRSRAARERLARLEAEAKDVAERRDQDRALRLRYRVWRISLSVFRPAYRGELARTPGNHPCAGQASRGWEGRDPGGIPGESAPFC